MNDLFPIKYVSKQTGLSPLVIRAWEKRYNVVTPIRTDTNRRLYCQGDIDRLKLLAAAIKTGINIGSIAQKSNDEIINLLTKSNGSGKQPLQMPNTTSTQTAVTEDLDTYLEQAVISVQSLDARKLNELLLKASVHFSRSDLLQNLLYPLIYRIGEMWRTGKIRIVNEHLATSVIRSFLGNMRNFYSPDEFAPAIISTTPQGQIHELGALLVSIAATDDGWNSVYLGPNMPSEEILAAVEKIKPRVLALSIVYPEDDPQIIQELKKIDFMLADDVRLIVGGRAAANYRDIIKQINADYIEDLEQFRQVLREARHNYH